VATPPSSVAAIFVAAVLIADAQTAPTVDEGRRLFFNARYHEAAEMALACQPSSADEELARDELRASGLLFQLRALLEARDQKRGDRPPSLDRCAPCGELMAAFLAATSHGQQAARKRLQANPSDRVALFFLGKIDLNYVWLQLGPLHHRSGWSEYWEARRSLDAVLKQDPDHVRARIARAWIDYIVDTKISWGVRWVLGGGDKNKALAALREAADHDAPLFDHAEALFSLWEMLIRERQMVEAQAVAERLAAMFPENAEVARFLEAKRQK
jgi:tetratricopeptide (TPR) repeat protein